MFLSLLYYFVHRTLFLRTSYCFDRRSKQYSLSFIHVISSFGNDDIAYFHTGSDNQDRTFRVSFNLKSMKYSSTESYYLVIADESGLQLPQREEFQIDIAFAVDDFDFFS